MTRGEIAFAIISGLLVNEATDICPWLAIRLVGWAARLRYPHAPERAATRGEELAALINDRPGKLFKLFTAVGFALHAVVVLRKNQQRAGWQAAAKPTPVARSATWPRRSRRAAVGSSLAKGISLVQARGVRSTAWPLIGAA